ncbi:MAG: MarR family transcriptional regulator [Chloroflexi bacterium]|jgi:DNA-binding MarR family transcriptional regulator|nr:MarR family transcriptional regulator [Chloroflexota bacterium]HZK17379.1 MarR family transcriptional regulator [Anaerolineaceae bacterium]
MKPTLNQRFQTLILRFHQLGGELPPLEKFGITPAQVVYLDYLGKHPNCQLSDLAEALQYKPASVSVMVSALERKGLVKKNPEQDDGRALSLSLTPSGSEIVAEIERFRSNRVETILEKLNQNEKENLMGLLEKTILKEEEN